MEDPIEESQKMTQETSQAGVFRPPSVYGEDILNGITYSHYSEIPRILLSDMSTECVLGIDEAGRGPVLGPMVYSVFYLPETVHESLLATTHHFDDSKVLTPATRSALMRALCTPGSDLHSSCGWAVRLLSACDIAAGMLRPTAPYNLNAQAMDATVDLIKGVLARGVSISHVYVDTIGSPQTYQRKLEAIFPSLRFTVEKKADSLYPCVSAASVCAKVSRDSALEICAESYAPGSTDAAAGGEATAERNSDETDAMAWGSGYPSDARCVTWMRANMDPVFGWGAECRFSWATAKEMLEVKNKNGAAVDWPIEEDGDGMKMTDFFASNGEEHGDELVNWYGSRVGEEVF